MDQVFALKEIVRESIGDGGFIYPRSVYDKVNRAV